MVDDLIRKLRANSPKDTEIPLPLFTFRNDRQVAAVAQALHGHEYAKNFSFLFNADNGIEDEDSSDDEDLISPFLNWDPLLREIESRENIENVTSRNTPTERLLPLFRNQFFHAVQRNSNVQQLSLSNINFSTNNTEGILSFLNANTPSLQNLVLFKCTAENREAARNFASALQQNSRIECLDLADCGIDVLCSILQSLTSSESASQLTKLRFQHLGISFGESNHDLAAECMQQYLESPNATIQNLWDSRSTGQTRFTSAMFGSRFCCTHPHWYLPIFADGCLKKHAIGTLSHVAEFRAREDQCQALVNALSEFKVQELSLMFDTVSLQEESVLDALKRNYIVQRVHCKARPGVNSNRLSDTNQARLDFYLNRNRQLARWSENPKLVPQELWSYATMLALEAGINTLYQSLLALSGQGVGLRERGRKRKCNDPSSDTVSD